MKSGFLKFSLLACIALFGVACSNRGNLSDNEFLIEGNVSGIDNGTVIALFRYDGNVMSRIATAKFRNGSFIFKAKTVSDVERLAIMPSGEGFSNMSLDIWVSPGAKIEIKGKGKQHPAWEIISSLPYQIEENLYTNASRDLIAESSRLGAEIIGLRKKRNAASEVEALTYRKAIDSLETIRKPLTIKRFYAEMDIMEKTDISPIWLDKLAGITSMLTVPDYYAEYADDIRKKAEALYGRMSEEDRNSPDVYPITANLLSLDVVQVQVGDDMADADLLDADGNTKHISDYLGKYLLLDFWYRGCGACIAALPEMKEISETYRDKLTVISISIDNETNWKKGMAEHAMPWVNIRDPKSVGGLAARYGVFGFPHYVAISPNGKVIANSSGYSKGSLKMKASEILK